MTTTIYHVTADVNRYVSLHDTRLMLFSKHHKQMCLGMSLASMWRAGKVELWEGRVGDFVGGPVDFADISLTAKAAEILRPMLEPASELLPFSFKEAKYWAIYLPWPSDCLDEQASDMTECWSGEGMARRHLVFNANRVSKDQNLFRLPSEFEYYCTQEFKDAIEDAGLTGLAFRFVWSSDGSVPKERKPSAKTKAKVKEEPMLKVNRRATKRDLLLERLWEAIDSFGSEEWLTSTLSVNAAELKGVQDVIAADTEVLKSAVKHGIAKPDLQRLCRSIAYKAVFEAFVAIEEECLDRSAALKGLHEDLLMADPKK